MPGEPDVRQGECRLAGETAQVRAARRFVAELLGDDWPDLDAAVLLTSELAANAVVHSASGRPGGKFTIRAEIRPRECLRVEVEDEGGPWTPSAGDGERGHGLNIVSAIADEWGRDGSPTTGWTVWARVGWPAALAPATGPAAGAPGKTIVGAGTAFLRSPKQAR